MHHTRDIRQCPPNDIRVQFGRRHRSPAPSCQTTFDLQTRSDKANHGFRGCHHVDLGVGDSYSAVCHWR